jgi:hypothetical protein
MRSTSLGRNVLLIAAKDVPLPGTPEVEVVRIDVAGGCALRRIGIGKTLSAAANLLAAGPDGLLRRIHADLAARGVRPAGYILNQSTLVDRSVACPQFVAAWAYPVDLLAYLRKIPLMVTDKGLKIDYANGSVVNRLVEEGLARVPSGRSHASRDSSPAPKSSPPICLLRSGLPRNLC